MMRFGVAKQSFHHNPWCGDDAFTYQDTTRAVMAVVDGLGHSRRAAHAAQIAVVRLAECTAMPLEAMLRAVEDALADTVGAALTIAVLHKTRASLEVCGVGNVGLQLVASARLLHFSGHPGIIGAGPNPFRPITYPYQAGDIVVMYTDGIRSAFSAGDLIHILHPDPERIARAILKEYARPNDDALVLVGCAAEATP